MLSQGQRQLLSVARVLLRSVRIVVMDEPTSNVDVVTDACVRMVLNPYPPPKRICLTDSGNLFDGFATL